MSAINFRLFLGWRCDKRDCDEQFLINANRGLNAWDYAVRHEARDQGWTFWVGRSNKVFCPKHLPAKGTKLTESTR